MISGFPTIAFDRFSICRSVWVPTRVQLAAQVPGRVLLLVDRSRSVGQGGLSVERALARALVNDPKILLADEPTGNLDAHSAQEVLGIMQSLSRQAGKTVIMVTHDPRAAAYGSRTAHLEKGEFTA